MKLLYSITAYPPSIGGAQLHHHLLAQQLQHKHSIQVVSQWDSNRSDWLLGTTLRAPSHNYDYTIDGIPVHRLGLSAAEKLKIAPFVPIYYPLMDLALPAIAACLEKHLHPYAENVDLIHNVRCGREGLSYASWKTARHHGIPFVFTPVHHPRWVGWRYRAYIELYRRADAVITLTHVEKKVLVELGVSEERISVTGIGPILADQVDPSGFRNHHKINGPMILFLGQHYEYKGYRQVLKAAPLVWKKVPEAHFVFVGPPVRQSEQDFSQATDPRIHRLGKVSLEEKTNALAACTLLCVPSVQESFGGVYTEAWSFGKPVIGGNIPAISEIVTDGVDGYLVVQDPEQIAERICHLLLHPSQLLAMGAAGKQKVESKFTWKRLAELTQQAYVQAQSGVYNC